MKRIDLKVGFACNNMCHFCVQGDKRFLYKPRKKEEIFQKLEESFKSGYEEVVFTGGEPTVHPDLVEAVAHASTLGYKNIQIQSNGRTFSDMDYCKKLVDAGVTEFSPSIHGFNPDTHDDLVQVKGAWKQVVQGFKNLKELNQRVITNTVITKQNYKELPKLALLLSASGVKQFQFAFIHILGTSVMTKEDKVNKHMLHEGSFEINGSLDIVPKKSEIMPYVLKGLDIGKKNGLVCMTEAIPFCMMKGYEWAIAEYNFMPVESQIHDAEWVIESYTDYRWNQGKLHGEQCKSCKVKNICEGPWREYPEIYGWDEFEPIIN